MSRASRILQYGLELVKQVFNVDALQIMLILLYDFVLNYVSN